MSEDASSVPKVGVLTRVIAAGMRFNGEQWKLHATLSLMPWVPEDGDKDKDKGEDKTKVTLSAWPSAIDGHLKNLKLFICPIAATRDALDPVLDERVCVDGVNRLADLSTFEKRDELWRRLIEGDNPRAWSALIDGLRASQQGTSLGKICQTPTTDANSGASQANNGGDPDKSTQGSQAADVIELPRADAAMLYGFQRAREVLRAMDRQKAQCQVNSCVIKTGGRFLDFADFSFKNKPWLGLDHEPPIRFAQATLSDAGVAGAKQGFAERDDLLAKERLSQEATYQKKLGPAQRQKADQQNSQRNKYLNGKTLDSRVQALQDHAKVRATSRAPTDCADACSSSDDTSVNKATDDVKATHALGAMPDLDEFGNPVLSPGAMQDAFELADEQVQQRLFAITAMPSLARLFNLVVDVEFDMAKFTSAITNYPPIGEEHGAVDHWGELAENTKLAPIQASYPHYMLLTTNLCRDDNKASGVPYVWTYAKFRLPPKNSTRDPGHFWPCSREEVDLQRYAVQNKVPNAGIRESNAVFQYDGVVDLGVVYCPDGLARNPRYDIVSLDTIQTVESDMQVDRRFKQMAGAAPGDQTPSATLGVQTRRTGGLALIDRWRQDQAVSQIATAKFHLDSYKSKSNDGSSQNSVFLDAEDMTTAYRLDVGVDTGVENENESGMVWRSLMNRKLTFGSKLNGTDWVERAVASLYTWGDKQGSKAAVERRRRADGASLSISSRIRQNAAQQGSSGENTAFVEQIMVTWHGDPLGVDCLDPGGSTDDDGSTKGSDSTRVAGPRRETVGMSIPANALPLDISFGLEDCDEAYRPPPLRYGWPYHLGLRPVYLGGVILPIESAVPRYEQNFGNGSALPNRDEFGGRRFLRHERIEAPALTVPKRIAQAFLDSMTGKGEPDRSAQSNGGSCILRTWRASTPLSKEPDATVRILFPPVMQLNEAMLHGVFDNDPGEPATVDGQNVNRPKDGLKSLDFSGDRGAKAKQAGGFPHSTNEKNPDDTPRGPAVFRLRPECESKTRKIPFYPDPAACSYVVAARRAGSDDDYLDGAPIIIPVNGKGVEYPNVFPLALEIRKQTTSRNKPAKSQKEIFPHGPVLAHADQSGAIAAGGGGLAVQHLVAELAPGENFEIDVWCIPSREELLDKFDIVEAVTVLLMRESAVENFADGTPNLACIGSLARHFPEINGLKVDGLKSNPLCGPGGMVLPHDTIIGWVADKIIGALSCRPMPELSAVTTLHTVHAIDQPLVPPEFILDSSLQWPQFVRLNDDMLECLMAGSSPDVCCRAPEHCGKEADSCKDCSRVSRLISGRDWSGLSDDGATNAIVKAKIGVDLLTTFDVELQARMVSPASGVFDNVNRGRTAEEKARGAYRPFGWLPTRPKSGLPLQWPKLSADAVAKDSVNLFGFQVDQSGRVDLQRYWAPLMNLNHLPDVPLAERGKNMRTVDLLKEQQQSARLNPQPKQLVEKKQPETQDAQASAQAVQPKPQGTQAKYIQPFRDGLARKFELQLVATSRFSNLFPDIENPSSRLSFSQTVSAWLPATKRPDPLSARSLRPAFTWIHRESRPAPSIWNSNGTRNVATAVRHCAIRLPFDRPHFTSGEGERVGVVIWPPDLMFGADPKDIEKDRVRRSEQDGRTLHLDDAFSDSDLGPGGEYVTRWGADPIRRGPRPKGWLIPAKAFLDVGNAELETNVLMPIPKKPDASAAGSGGANANGSGGRKTDNNGTSGSSSGTSASSDTAGREFMLVSLLTYEPRFDIDFERWYIDVHIDADQVPEPFIRLGLIRFQKHARRELQVSEPIAEWIQIMPKRAVSVSVEAPDKLSRRTELTIEVGTPALYEGAAPLIETGSDHAGASGDAPFMRAYLLRRDQLNGGGSVQSIVPPEENFNALSTQLLPRRTPDGTVWGASIGFVCSDAPPASSEAYSVYIEEVEAYQSTANPVDDLTGLATRPVVESGPRFAAIIPIKIPAPVSSPQPSPVSNPPSSPPHHPVKKKPVHPKPTYSNPPPAKERTYD
jgi:hypothetical protein